jgi:hypothetical protein
MQINGNVEILIFERDKPIRRSVVRNAISNNGLSEIALGFAGAHRGTSTAVWSPRYCHFGTGAGTKTATTTALTTPLTDGYVFVSKHSSGATRAVIQAYVGEDHDGLNGSTLTEIGLSMKSSTAGTLLASANITAIVKSSLIQIVVNWSFNVK